MSEGSPEIKKNKQQQQKDKVKLARDNMQGHSNKVIMILRQNSKTIPVSNTMQWNKQGFND